MRNVPLNSVYGLYDSLTESSFSIGSSLSASAAADFFPLTPAADFFTAVYTTTTYN